MIDPIDRDILEHFAAALKDHCDGREIGHCVVVRGFVDDYAVSLAEMAHDPESSTHVWLVSSTPTHPFDKTPTSAVEERNNAQADGFRLCLIAPSRSSVEDSLDSTTFEVLDTTPTDPLFRNAAHSLRAALPNETEQTSREVIAIARENDHPFSEWDELRFLARIALAEDPAASIGASLPELGLLPDSSIRDGAERDELVSQLSRNASIMETLTQNSAASETLREAATAVPAEWLPTLRDALHDAQSTHDPRAITAAIESDGQGTIDVRDVESIAPTPNVDLRILRFSRDIVNEDGWVVKPKPRPTLGVKVHCDPAPRRIVGLKEIEVAIVQDTDDGPIPTAFQKSFRSGLPAATIFERSVGVSRDELEPGYYRFKVTLYSDQNAIIKQEVSSQAFAIDDRPAQPVTVGVPSVSVAHALAFAAGAGSPTDATITLTKPDNGLGTISVVYPDAAQQWSVEYPAVLWEAERRTIMDPDSLGRWVLSVHEDEIVDLEMPPLELIPTALIETRTALMARVAESQLSASTTLAPTIAACNTASIAGEARAYVEAWISALAEAPSLPALQHLLGIDHARVDGSPHGPIRLVGPFHPLRLAWFLGFDDLIRDQISLLGQIAPSQVQKWVSRITPQSAPQLAADPAFGWFRFAENLTLGWALMLPTETRDAERASSDIRKWLGLTRSDLSRVKAKDIQDRVVRYLDLHPYAEQVLINVVRPGDAGVVLDALIAVADHSTAGSLRFVVRLFDNSEPHSYGQAFDGFMAGDRSGEYTKSKAALDRFHTAADSVLYPALTYSKHPIDRLIDDPTRYPAHLSVFLDHFRTEVSHSLDEPQRSLFLGGLMIRPDLGFVTGDDTHDPAWEESVGATGLEESLIADAWTAFNSAATRIIPGAESASHPVFRLSLTENERRLIGAVHESSDWVVIIDPTFSDAYLDRPGTSSDIPTYVLDHASSPDRVSSRRITVSTRSRRYLSEVLRPLATDLGLTIDDIGAKRVLSTLNVLGVGLVLRLIDRGNRAKESLTLGLTALHLAATGTLRHAIVIPLDLYQDLFTSTSDGPNRRADLLLIRPVHGERRFEIALIEVKARSGLNGNIPQALIDDVTQQLDLTRSALFNGLLATSDIPLERAALTDRFRILLTTHLDRAIRFDSIDKTEAQEIRSLLSDLENGYSIKGPDMHAFVFDLDGTGTESTEAGDTDCPITLWRIGRDVIDALIAADSANPTTGPVAPMGPTIDVAAVFTGNGPETTWDPIIHPQDTPSTPPEQAATIKPADTDDTRIQPPPDEGGTDDDYTGPPAEELAMLGSPSAHQFGIVGHLVRPRRPVALDTDGTSVISVFGAQGSGKSYTIGTLIEAALIRQPSLTKLEQPLGGIVFHYSKDAGYQPEFASMIRPNSEPSEIAALKGMGARPAAIEDITILTSPGTLAERRSEFPDCDVEPLQIGTSELTADHWKLLMGLATTGTQMYAKELSRILETLRSAVTFATFAEAIEDSALNRGQKDIALLRLEWVRGFVADAADTFSLMRPGRLVIVDLRDEYIDEDQALGLFMVVLDLMTGKADAQDSGNKLVVFDEAHKYIKNGALVERLVTKIREMRHLGTTVIIASQDPPSLPASVVELSTTLIAHRFTSPQWLNHLKRYNAGFADHAPTTSKFAQLEPGQAYVHATVGDEVFTRPQLVEFRPRLSAHGGGTKRATRS